MINPFIAIILIALALMALTMVFYLNTPEGKTGMRDKIYHFVGGCCVFLIALYFGVVT